MNTRIASALLALVIAPPDTFAAEQKTSPAEIELEFEWKPGSEASVVTKRTRKQEPDPSKNRQSTLYYTTRVEKAGKDLKIQTADVRLGPSL